MISQSRARQVRSKRGALERANLEPLLPMRGRRLAYAGARRFRSPEGPIATSYGTSVLTTKTVEVRPARAEMLGARDEG
jgi:hypothetical protein